MKSDIHNDAKNKVFVMCQFGNAQMDLDMFHGLIVYILEMTPRESTVQYTMRRDFFLSLL